MDSRRDRIYSMRAGCAGRAPMSSAFVQHFDACLGCMACVTACPSGVQQALALDRAHPCTDRASLSTSHRRSNLPRRAVLLVPHPAGLRVALAPVAVLRLPLFSLRRTRLLSVLPARALLSLAPDVRWRQLRARVPARTRAVGRRRATVGLLAGCVQRVAFPHVNRATVNVLAAEDCDVLVPERQGCCGALALHAGRLDDARRFARAVSCRSALPPTRSASRGRCSTRSNSWTPRSAESIPACPGPGHPEQEFG